ncbi:cation diffusion facilitator family transporter [Poriferisphaera sp. WC338]|uniref:cation diffusion facilitator family transporter n=1 Tax=Poriferisphaera sp. WC338 TaxID=3425129 RepID=UPI003D814077
MERATLRFSIIGGLFFMVVGITWGLWIGSSMILFDGLYSVLGVMLTSLSAYVSSLVMKPDDERFPFGRQQFIPFVLMLRAAVLSSLCLFAGLSSLLVILSGGREVNAASAVVYAIVSTGGCLCFWLYLRSARQRLQSDVVDVESKQWLMDTMLSGAVLVGFVINLLVLGTRLDWLSYYIDSGMVFIACLIFLPMPIGKMIVCIRELLVMGVGSAYRNRINHAVRNVLEKHDLDRFALRAAKGGDMITIEVDIVLPEEFVIQHVGVLDRIREEIKDAISFVGEPIWLSVAFTGDEKWL